MVSLYDLSIPPTIRALEQLSGELNQGEKWCEDNQVEKSTILSGKIADMLPLTFQVQAACNSAKGLLFRVGGEENTPMEDNEKTFEELYSRIERTVALLKAAKRGKFVDENQEIVVKMGPSKEATFNSLVYIQNFALPNFFFHRTTAYLVMRAAGVNIGKQEYLGFSSLTTSAATN